MNKRFGTTTALEPDSIKFANDLKKKISKANKPILTKKMNALRAEYLDVVRNVEIQFAAERLALEKKHAHIRAVNEKEFNEKMNILFNAYSC